MNKILLGLLAALLLLPAAASAATKNPAAAGFRTCPTQAATGWKCATLRYPLDPSGRRAGRVTMRAKMRLATGGQANQAIFALAGGPGQAAVPLAEGFDDLLGGLTAGYDVVVPDPRGTLYLPRGGADSGRDNPFVAGLMCWNTLTEVTAATDSTKLVADCAKELGPQRAYYTTQHTVRDLERLRQQLGYDKIVLYGTSYGTKTALDYARSFPQHVQKLILDSSLDQLDPLSRNSLQAIPRALEELCVGGACNGITSDIRGDWINAVTRLNQEPITEPLVGNGIGWRIEVSDLVNLLFIGDFSSSSRLQLPSALAALRAGWVRPLARLAALNGVGRAVPRDPDLQEGVDPETFLELNPVLYLATACGDINAPWARRDQVKTRMRKLGQSAASSLQAQPLPGWNAESLAQTSEASSCLGWPDARRRQLPTSQPQVPVILLSGRQDVRTPLEDSQRLQGAIVNSRLQAVNFVGHSVLGGELEGCANRALRGFMRDTAAPNCIGDDSGSLLQLVDPRRENYAPDPAVPGEPGQTVSAARATLLDLWQQLRADADNGWHLIFANGWIGLEDGQAVALPLGFVIDQPRSILLGSYSSVRGIKLSGRLTLDEQFRFTGGRVLVRGEGSIGSFTISASGLDGRLDDQTVHAAPLSYPDLPAPMDNALLPRWRPTPGLGHAPMLTRIRKR